MEHELLSLYIPHFFCTKIHAPNMQPSDCPATCVVESLTTSSNLCRYDDEVLGTPVSFVGSNPQYDER
jgi:hypothetical protein